MVFSPETSALVVLAVAAFVVVLWGYQRSQKAGRLGLLAWGQSLSVTAPWFVFITCVLLGISLDTIGVIMLLVASVGAYIYLGNLRREAGQAEELKQKAIARMQDEETQASPSSSTQSEEAEDTPPAIAPIDPEDLQAIKGIFGIDTFFSTESIPYQDGAIFKGNLRGDPEKTHERLTQSLGDRLGDKYRLFLVEDPEGKPVVIVLPSTNDPKTTTLIQKNLALVLLVATLATTLEALGILQGFDLSSNLSRYKEVLPLSLGLWAILGAHELAHWVISEKYNVKLSIPFFLPNWQIGAFGSITRFESLLPTRNALFDIAIAGPIAGGALSLVMLITGLVLSQPNSLFQIPSQFFGGSILVGSLAKLFMGDAIQAAVVAIHPLTILGWLGLVITALNLMPAGRLDGGRVIQAIYGRKTARRTTLATLIILGIVALFNPSNPIPLYWALIIAFIQRDAERPSLNELIEPDDNRALLGLAALLFMLVTLIPLSPSLAGQLGIG
ncbi:site-2 protease family protein [[Limnothrix rosea] IAM M-220]|uniref:site-2 protease family protein n=1 Tax=[Limnothrix rosea] IAM M-220 TaxID=454133 RepID=UPI000960757F|nr:site-2 protease family protein [[Limnothrix rosea] IAM M-220]OKH17374.1 site-2 protease family protein [[Limnothrix rosea] IAM M-220]